MYVDKLLKIITLYGVLEKGCSKHKQYRAKRKPRVECVDCIVLWEFRQQLNKLLKETGIDGNG